MWQGICYQQSVRMSSKKVISEALECGNSKTITIARTHVESGIYIAFNLT